MMMNQHEGIQCDVCVRNNFRGCRYKCLICADYDLCCECFDRGLSSGTHLSTHPMQSILTRSDIALFFGGEDVTITSSQCLTCPYCGELGLTGTMLMQHLIYKHSSLNECTYLVLCPICATRPIGNNNYTTNDLPGHLVVEHRMAGPRSLITRIDELAAETLRNPQPPSTLTQARRSSSSRSSRNSMDAVFLELMSHLPDVRFDSRATASGVGSSPSVQALQQIQLQLQQHQLDQRLARRAFAGQPPPDFVPTRERPPPPTFGGQSTSRRTSSGGRSREAAALALQAALASEARRYNGNGSSRRIAAIRGASNEPVESNGAGDGAESSKSKSDSVRTVKPEDNDKFILKKFLKNDLKEKEHVKRDHERADRSLFVQAMLLSAFSTEFQINENYDPSQIAQSGANEVKATSSKLHIHDKKSKKKKNKKNKLRKQYEGVCIGAVGESSSKASIGENTY